MLYSLFLERNDAPRLWLKPPRPLITPRVDFCFVERPPLPIIAPRINFTARVRERALLAQSRALAPEINSRQGQPTPGCICVPVQATNGSRPPRNSTEKISKLKGEPGRPGSGGYALEKVLKDLGWEPNNIKGFIADVRKEAGAKLDTSMSYQGQNRDIVQELCTLLSGPDRWPILADYADCWPVIAVLKLQLKYKAEASRRRDNQRARAARVEEERKEEEEVATFLLELGGDTSMQLEFTERV